MHLTLLVFYFLINSLFMLGFEACAMEKENHDKNTERHSSPIKAESLEEQFRSTFIQTLTRVFQENPKEGPLVVKSNFYSSRIAKFIKKSLNNNPTLNLQANRLSHFIIGGIESRIQELTLENKKQYWIPFIVLFFLIVR